MATRLSEWVSPFSSSSTASSATLAAAFTSFLVVGVLFLVPVIARVFREYGGASGMAAAVPLVVVCVVYGLVVYRSDRVALGLFVAFAVFVTVWSPGLPWGPTQGSLAWATTQNWLAGLALVGLLVYYTWHGWNPRKYFSGVHVVLGGFVLWTIVSAPFTAGPYPDFAFQFGIYVLQAWGIFVVISWLSETQRLSLSAASVTFAIVIIGHTIVGVFEFITETSVGAAGTTEVPAVVSQLSLGPFGTHPVGPYVSGFVGSSALGSLLAMIAPLLCVLALRERGLRRFTWAALWLLLAFVLRATGWDTGRGAFLLGTAVVGIGLFWCSRETSLFSLNPVRTGFAALMAALGVALTLLPSSDAGGSTRISMIGIRITNVVRERSIIEHAGGVLDAASINPVGAVVGVARATNATAEATNASAEYGSVYFSPERAASAVNMVSIPLFDLSGLGIRLQQIIAGIDLFFQYPIFGIGGANFYFVSEAFGLPELWLHTVYVALLAETGLPGFLLYVTALGFVVRAGCRLLGKESRRDGDWYLALGLIAAFCAHLGTMLFQPTYMRAQLLLPFWALCGLIIGTERRLTA